jgi:hypothetical protein
MTVAVCLKCGDLKHGAWTPCTSCGYCPDSDESYTKHLLASDHYLSREQLEKTAACVKAGEPVEFSPALLKKAWVRAADMRKRSLGCTVAGVMAFAVILVLAAAAVYGLLR